MTVRAMRAEWRGEEKGENWLAEREPVKHLLPHVET